jgi:hypothetical protein
MNNLLIFSLILALLILILIIIKNQSKERYDDKSDILDIIKDNLLKNLKDFPEILKDENDIGYIGLVKALSKKFNVSTGNIKIILKQIANLDICYPDILNKNSLCSLILGDLYYNVNDIKQRSNFEIVKILEPIILKYLESYNQIVKEALYKPSVRERMDTTKLQDYYKDIPFIIADAYNNLNPGQSISRVILGNYFGNIILGTNDLTFSFFQNQSIPSLPSIHQFFSNPDNIKNLEEEFNKLNEPIINNIFKTKRKIDWSIYDD